MKLFDPLLPIPLAEDPKSKPNGCGPKTLLFLAIFLATATSLVWAF